jgi:hypothetical protein
MFNAKQWTEPMRIGASVNMPVTLFTCAVVGCVVGNMLGPDASAKALVIGMIFMALYQKRQEKRNSVS